MIGMSIRQHRPLAAAERDLLAHILGRSGDAAGLLAQLDTARVVGRCECGCPTVDLAVGEPFAPDAPPSQLVADAAGRSPEGVDVEVLVFARDGRLSCLEVYAPAGEAAFSLPTPEGITWIAPPVV